uniref:Ig-like domain-containing protein n=1 Tax=Periophthalmus magnuspinnatus TaxID=409849 RepID=A0A3B4AGC7_9GOBI
NGELSQSPPSTVGQNATLQCSYRNKIFTKLYWYKQSLENTLTMASTYLDLDIYTEIHDNRSKLDNIDGKNNLEIANVQMADVAVYHCLSCVGSHIDFLAVEPGHSVVL